jgi:hypothetical protein
VLRVNAALTSVRTADMNDDLLITAVNHAIRQENSSKTSDKMSLGLDSVEVANCFIHLAGNEPAVIAPEDGEAQRDSKPQTKIVNLMIPLVSTSGTKRTEYMEFDETGAITKAAVIEQPAH